MSVVAFRNARKSPSESIADDVLLKTLETHGSRLYKIISLPFDFLVACKDALVAALLFPFRFVSKGFSHFNKVGESLIKAAQQWFAWLLYLPGQMLSSMLQRLGSLLGSLGKSFTNQTNWLGEALSRSPVGVYVLAKIQGLSDFATRAQIHWIVLNDELSSVALAVEDGGAKALTVLCEMVSKTTADLMIRKQTTGQRLSRDYNNVNEKLSEFAFMIEDLLHKLSSWIRKRTGSVSPKT